MSSDKRVLTPNDAARILMVSPVTLRQWAQKGKIKSHTTLGGHRRFLYDEIIEFARRENITVLDDMSNQDDKAKRVLIVDDDKSFSQLLYNMLSAKYVQWEFDYAHDGFDAGIKVHQFKPDVMLIDLKLPGLEGDEVCRNVKSKPELENLQIIGMTGFVDSENVQSFLKAGAEAVLQKPLNTEKLYALLDA